MRFPRPNVEQDVTIDGEATVARVLRELRIPPDSVLVVRGNEPVPLDAPAREGELLRILTVFSGG